MSIKDLTKEKHDQAEHTAFMKAVFARTLPMSLWEDYTYQKVIWYRAIEKKAKAAGLLDSLPGIERGDLILEDYNEMMKSKPAQYHTYREVSKDYAVYINSLTDKNKIMAHLYVWHMGDMFGGQMIKKIVEAPHKHLEFENSKEMIGKVRMMLTDDMADEANVAFDWAIRILGEYDESLG
jgi:heme oxygenase